jgi:hypothetical protein
MSNSDVDIYKYNNQPMTRSHLGIDILITKLFSSSIRLYRSYICEVLIVLEGAKKNDSVTPLPTLKS